MSVMGMQFKAYYRVRAWKEAAQTFDALSMAERLPLLEALSTGDRSTFAIRCKHFLKPPAAAEVQWTAEVAERHQLPAWEPGTLVADQIQEAREYVESYVRETVRQLRAENLDGLDALDVAVRRGLLLGATAQLKAVAKNRFFTDGRGRITTLSQELVDALVSLVRSGLPVTILSLMRHGAGPHGKPRGRGHAVCSAVDISGYGGRNIHLKNPGNATEAVAGVVAVVENLGPGRYTLGLPRPGGGQKIDPVNDVFLPVADLKDVCSFKSFGSILEPARTALRAAMGRNPAAEIARVMSDAVDHLHVKALAPGEFG